MSISHIKIAFTHVQSFFLNSKYKKKRSENKRLAITSNIIYKSIQAINSKVIWFCYVYRDFKMSSKESPVLENWRLLSIMNINQKLDVRNWGMHKAGQSCAGSEGVRVRSKTRWVYAREIFIWTKHSTKSTVPCLCSSSFHKGKASWWDIFLLTPWGLVLSISDLQFRLEVGCWVPQ